MASLQSRSLSGVLVRFQAWQLLAGAYIPYSISGLSSPIPYGFEGSDVRFGYEIPSGMTKL